MIRSPFLSDNLKYTKNLFLISQMPFANPNLSNVDNIFFTQRSLSLDRVAPGTDLAGYPGNIFAGIRYGRISG